MSENRRKEKFPLYLPPEKREEVKRRFKEEGSPSETAFIEKALDFYLGYLDSGGAGRFLPVEIKSYLDGRIASLEDRLAKLTFKQAVELDMMAGILADAYEFSEEGLARRRAESIQNVKRTNGRISFRDRVAESWEDDDEWQD